MLALGSDELSALSSLVGDIRSCYTAGDASSRGFVGTESLRAAGARAVVVLPLWAQRNRFGTLIVAHSRPLQLTGDRVEPLELLADHVAAVLETWLATDRPAAATLVPGSGFRARRRGLRRSTAANVIRDGDETVPSGPPVRERWSLE